MAIFATCFRKSGKLIDFFPSESDALQALSDYEDRDRENETYFPDCYEVVSADYFKDELLVRIICQDSCTAEEAASHLDRGACVHEDGPHILDELKESCLTGIPDEDAEILTALEDMLVRGIPLQDWAIVDFLGNRYFIEYVL